MDMLTNGRRVDDESFTYLNWLSIITNYFMDRILDLWTALCLHG